MHGTTPVAIANRFNAHINEGNLGALSSMMTDDHVFIDSANSVVSSKAKVITAWSSFFNAFPDAGWARALASGGARG